MDVITESRTENRPHSDEYEAYLRSFSWRITRNHALRNAGWRCQRCSGGRDLQVHHKTYERLGHEWDQDLEVLCSGCHDAHHRPIEAARQHLPLYVKLVYEALRAGPFSTIADLAEDVKRSCARLKIPYHTDTVAKAIHQASPALPKNSPFYSSRPVSIYEDTPQALEREISRTEATDILAECARRLGREVGPKLCP